MSRWSNQSSQYLNLARGSFQHHFMPYSNVLYVTQGPEFDYLKRAEEFLLQNGKLTVIECHGYAPNWQTHVSYGVTTLFLHQLQMV